MAPKCLDQCPHSEKAKCILLRGHKGRFHRSYTKIWPVAG